jgi:hypothetical protein
VVARAATDTYENARATALGAEASRRPALGEIRRRGVAAWLRRSAESGGIERPPKLPPPPMPPEQPAASREVVRALASLVLTARREGAHVDG